MGGYGALLLVSGIVLLDISLNGSLSLNKSSSTELTQQDVYLELKVVSAKWETLGFLLGLPQYWLDAIKTDCYYVDDCYRKMLHAWFDADSDLSWDKITWALNQMGHKHAKCMRERYTHSECMEEDAKTQVNVSLGDHRERMEEIESWYNELACKVMTSMEKGKVNLKRVQFWLTQIPVSLKYTNQHFLEETYIQLVHKAQSLQELFSLLSLSDWNFLNYGLLEYMAVTFGGDEVKKSMQMYICELTKFRRAVMLSEFLKLWHNRINPSPEFPKLVAKLNKTRSHLTLQDIEDFRVAFSKNYSLVTFALMYGEFEEGSVVLTWFIPSSIAPQLVQDVKTGGDGFLKEHSITEVSIDGHTVNVNTNGNLSPNITTPVYFWNVRYAYFLQPGEDIMLSCSMTCSAEASPPIWYHTLSKDPWLPMSQIATGPELGLSLHQPPVTTDVGYFCCTCIGGHPKMHANCFGVAYMPHVAHFAITQKGETVSGVHIGDYIMIECSVYGFPSHVDINSHSELPQCTEVSLAWFTKIQFINIPHATINHSDVYTCVALLHASPDLYVMTENVKRSVVVYAPPTITGMRKLTKNEQKMLDYDVDFDVILCNVTSSVNFSVTWLFNGKTVTATSKCMLTYFTDEFTCTLEEPQASQGEYECVVNTVYKSREISQTLYQYDTYMPAMYVIFVTAWILMVTLMAALMVALITLTGCSILMWIPFILTFMFILATTLMSTFIATLFATLMATLIGIRTWLGTLMTTLVTTFGTWMLIHGLLMEVTSMGTWIETLMGTWMGTLIGTLMVTWMGTSMRTWVEFFVGTWMFTWMETLITICETWIGTWIGILGQSAMEFLILDWMATCMVTWSGTLVGTWMGTIIGTLMRCLMVTCGMETGRQILINRMETLMVPWRFGMNQDSLIRFLNEHELIGTLMRRLMIIPYYIILMGIWMVTWIQIRIRTLMGTWKGTYLMGTLMGTLIVTLVRCMCDLYSDDSLIERLLGTLMGTLIGIWMGTWMETLMGTWMSTLVETWMGSWVGIVMVTWMGTLMATLMVTWMGIMMVEIWQAALIASLIGSLMGTSMGILIGTLKARNKGTPSIIISEVYHPNGIAVNDRREIVVAEQNCISMFSCSGEKIRTFRTSSALDQIWQPHSVAFDSAANILVTDVHSHCIKKFTPDGKFLTAVGREGSEELDFKYPAGIGINHKNKKVYVCDQQNHRVQILNEDLTFFSCFGSWGSGEGQFHGPQDVAFDSTGNVYITDLWNYHIQVFTPEGIFLRKFEMYSGSEGEFAFPLSISIDSGDRIYVIEYRKYYISIFTCEGNILQSFEMEGARQGEFKYTYRIAVDPSGMVYVSDSFNHQVQGFKIRLSNYGSYRH